METKEPEGFAALVESVGGADMFVWLVTFGVLIVFAGVMVYLNRNAERD
ncbi:MAG: hypothetical protein JXK04_02585 [Campylobacterales bacterium]|nr:hypothetical protein [Campylobacterales bacterium]